MTYKSPSERLIPNKLSTFRRRRIERYGECNGCNNGLDKVSKECRQAYCYDCRQVLLERQRATIPSNQRPERVYA